MRHPMVVLALLALIISHDIAAMAERIQSESRTGRLGPSAGVATLHTVPASGGPLAHAAVSLPYPIPVARGAARPLLYKTLGVDTNQSLRQAANGAIRMGTAIGEGYVTDATPSVDQPTCQRKCAQSGGCRDSNNTHALCGCASDGTMVSLNCTGSGTITAVTFAAIGTPTGNCGNFSDGKCTGDHGLAKAYVAKQCFGKRSCSLNADINTFNSGKDPCYGVAKHIAVAVVCSTPQPLPPPPPPPEQAPSGMNPYPSNVLPKWKKGIHTAETYRAVASREYDMTSPENACKFDATEPAIGQYDWEGCDLLANFTNLDMNGTFFGTTVVWGIALPSWISRGHYNRTALTAHMVEHIRAIMSHYDSGPLKMESIVLVNEAASNSIQDGRLEDGMWKGNEFYPTIPDYVAIAFEAARIAAPHVKLFYNDYGWGVGSKFDVIYHMLTNFSSRTPPVVVDGVGLQMHCDVGSWGGHSLEFARNLSENIHNLTTTFKGLEFRVTEMDVTCGGYSHPCSDALFERQAQVYGDILEACLNNTGCTGFETWGFVSNQTANTKNVRIDNHSSLWWGGVAPCWVNILLSEDRLILPGVVLVRAARRLICTRGWALERDPFPST